MTDEITFKGICKGYNQYGKLEIELIDQDFTLFDFEIKQPLYKNGKKCIIRINVGARSFNPVFNERLDKAHNEFITVDCKKRVYENEQFGKGCFYELINLS